MSYNYDPVDGCIDSRYNYPRAMSARAYSAAIGIILLIGFAINAATAYYFTDSIMSIPPLQLIIGYFVICFAGIFLSAKSDNPFVSFIGYLMVVVPCGAIIAIVVDSVSVDVVVHAAITTSGLTIIMIIAGTAWPSFFESLGRVLFTGLWAIIIIELVMCFFFGATMPSVWHYLVVALFCFYIGYDWAEAQDKRHTLDNAVDACVGLYLDIINIFVRLISANSSSKSSRRR